jgi:peptide/nickel transport system substrate-binding protein
MGLAGAAVMASPFRVWAQGERPTITIAVDNLWANIAPINGISTTTRRFFPNFYDHLIDRDYTIDEQGLELQPGLATDWSQNGKVWTLTLRDGVKFHNGEMMTAEDVAFTLGADRLWGEKPYEPRGKTFTAGFVRVEATGPLTVEIETAEEDPYIPGKLTGYIGFVVPKAYYLEKGVDGFGQMPVGTGPYKVTVFRSGEVLEMEAFDDYWGGKPPAAKLVWKIVPEYAARFAGLVSGEFDFIANIPTDQEAQLESYDNVKVKRALAANYPAFAFNTRPDPEDNPLVDPNLRKAMVRAIDMDAIVEALFGDKTFHPNRPFNFPEYGKFYDPDSVNPYSYDVAAAKELLAKTDYKGQELDWHITRQFYPNYEAAAEIMIEMWREIGINVRANILENFELVYTRPFHMMNMSMSTDFIPGDPYQPLWLDWGPTSSRATAKWKTWDPTPGYLAAGEVFAKATDFDARKAAFEKLRDEWEDVTPGYYLWKSIYNWAHRADIEWTQRPDGEMRMFGKWLDLPA